MNRWLMKSEPSVYGIDDLARDRQTGWDGIRNYQVRNLLRDEFRKGDTAFFYHSSCDAPGIVGVMAIAGAARPDPTQFDRKSEYFDAKASPKAPIWLTIDVSFQSKLPRVISLDELRRESSLADLPVLRRGNRLSITPVSAAQWERILKLARNMTQHLT